MGKFLCDVGVRIVCKDLCKIPPIVCVWPRLSRSLLQNWLGLSIPYYLRHTENHLHHHLYIPFHNLIIGVEGKERYLIRLMPTLRCVHKLPRLKFVNSREIFLKMQLLVPPANVSFLKSAKTGHHTHRRKRNKGWIFHTSQPENNGSCVLSILRLVPELQVQVLW